MIRFKRIYGLLFIIVTLLGYTLFSIYRDLKTQTITEFNTQQALLAHQTSAGIERHFGHYLMDLSGLAEISAIVNLTGPGKELMHGFHMKHAHEIQAVSRIDENGRLLYTAPYNEGVIGSDISRQAHVRQIMDTRKPVVSEVFTAVQGYRTIACHVPVFEGLTFKGSLAVLIPFRLVAEEFMKGINIGRSVQAWVISRKGVILYSPQAGQAGQSIFDVYRDSPSLIDMAREMTAGKQGEAWYAAAGNQGNGGSVAHQAVYCPIRLGSTFWSIAISAPEKAILSTMTGFRNKLVLIALLFVAAASMYSFFIIRARTVLKEEKKRRQAEAALLESEKKYRTILEEIEDGYFEVDLRGNMTFFNNAICHILGYSRSELVEKNNREFMDAETGKKVFETFNNVYQTGKPFKGFDWEVIQKDGTRRHLDTAISLLRDPSGRVTGFRGIARDITERKQAEAAMHEYKNRYQALFDRSLDCVFIHDFKGNFIDANEAAIHMLGYDRKYLPKLAIKDILSEDQFPLAAEVLKDLQAFGFHKNLAGFKLKHKSGRIVEVETKSAVIHKDGKPFAIQGIARDVTEKRKMEAQFHQSQKMEAIGTLAGGIAHDFNNILTVMLGNAEMASHVLPEASPATPYIRQVHLAGIRARDLVRQILAFTRQTDHDLKTVALQDIVKEAATFLRSSIPTTIDIRLDIQPDCPPILADPTQIHQILMNLCTNAYHAMRESGGTLSITLHRANNGGADGDVVRLEISDTGTGIRPEVLDRIFDPYYTTKAKGEGTGMGLAVVQGIVKSHGGGIVVESRVGSGSTFRVDFPVARKPSKDVTPFSPGNVIPGGSEHILVVDDESVVTDIHRLILESLGYRVSAFTSSATALEAFLAGKAHFDLVLTDMTMPRLNGLQFAGQILAARPDTPVILCTGFNDLVSEATIRDAGIRKLIIKPVCRKDLAVAIRSALDDKA